MFERGGCSIGEGWRIISSTIPDIRLNDIESLEHTRDVGDGNVYGVLILLYDVNVCIENINILHLIDIDITTIRNGGFVGP